MSPNENYDFFNFLDEQLKIQKKLYPPKKKSNQDTPQSSENPSPQKIKNGFKKVSQPRNFSQAVSARQKNNKSWTPMFDIEEKSPRHTASRNCRRKKNNDKYYLERKSETLKGLDPQDVENIEYEVRKNRAEKFRQ